MDYITILLRTILAAALGGTIGMERESKHHPAGFRTHTLVCVGAAIVMLLSELLFVQYHTAYGLMSDPARMGAQVISGIGFLGAGTIMRYGSNVRGLTTAASIWATGCIGLAVGAGFYMLASVATVVILVTLVVFNNISKLFERKSKPSKRELHIELRNDPKVLGAITFLLARGDLQTISILGADGDNAITLTVRFQTGSQLPRLALQLAKIDGVSHVDIL